MKRFDSLSVSADSGEPPGSKYAIAAWRDLIALESAQTKAGGIPAPPLSQKPLGVKFGQPKRHLASEPSQGTQS